MTERTPALRSLAAELRRVRDDALRGTEREESDLIAEVHISKTTWWRAMTGEVCPNKGSLFQILTICDADDTTSEEVLQLWEEARQEEKMLRPFHQGLRPDYRAWIACEAQADHVSVLEPLAVPGLLQTPEYARELIMGAWHDADPAELDAHVKTRIDRQAVVRRAVNPLPVTAVIDEAVLRRPIGDSQVMAGQLQHLQTMARLRHVTLQVIPFNAGAHPGLTGSSLGIAHFKRRRDRSVVYLDSTAGDVIFDTEQDLRRYQRVFDAAQAKALTPDESLDFIITITNDYTSETT